MSTFRTDLPQLRPGVRFLTDGGLETDLIFHHDVDLPYFAACELLRSRAGYELLVDYYDEHAAIAVAAGLGFSIDTPTWRANPEWTDRLGYSHDDFVAVNRSAVRLAQGVRERHGSETSPMPITGVLGPRGDGYRVDEKQTVEQAEAYHARQIDVFAETAVDYISALTINYSEEAVGIVRAATVAGMPVVISFTVETDGALASGETLESAISVVDEATDAAAAYFMVNCAHPTHLPASLGDGAAWAGRVRGIRANASRRSHEELDEAEELDDGDPVEFGAELAELAARMPHLTVLGGCCGSDSRHIRAIADAIGSADAPRS